MLNTKGLVTLTEYQQVGWRLNKVENCDNLWEAYIAESDFTFLWNLLLQVILTLSNHWLDA